MDKCEFCMTEIPESAGAYVPSGPMRIAVESGYDPRISPTWPRMKQLPRLQEKQEKPLSEQEVSVRWRELLLSGGNPWRLCENCFIPLRPYLPNGNEAPVASEKGAVDWLVPLHASFLAVMAGYLGLFSLLMPILAPLLAPFAVIMGIIALYDVRKHPEKTGFGRAVFAIVIGVIMSLLAIFVIAMMLFFG